MPLTGLDRCNFQGHELDSAFSYRNGLLVGYCTRCEARVEIPWFRGGTVSVLAAAMARQALVMQRPAASVLDDLGHVEGLLRDDLTHVEEALALVRQARDRTIRLRSMQ